MGRDDDEPERSPEDDDGVRARLNALTTLGFWTPKDHKAYKKAQQLDAHLEPVRQSREMRCSSSRGTGRRPTRRVRRSSAAGR